MDHAAAAPVMTLALTAVLPGGEGCLASWCSLAADDAQHQSVTADCEYMLQEEARHVVWWMAIQLTGRRP